MTQFDESLFGKSLFGGGSSAYGAGVAAGQGSASGSAQVERAVVGTASGQVNLAAQGLRVRESAGSALAAADAVGTPVRVRPIGCQATGLSELATQYAVLRHAEGVTVGLGTFVGTGIVTFAETGTLSGAGVISGALAGITLPPPSRAGVRLASWLRPAC